MLTTNPDTAIAFAACLLDAIARDAEDAVDAEVPITCGLAAEHLYGSGVDPLITAPAVGDDLYVICDALITADTLLSTLPPAAMTESVYAAQAYVQTALAAAGLPNRHQ